MMLEELKFANELQCKEYYIKEHNINSYSQIAENDIISWESNKGLFCIRQIGSAGLRTLRTFRKIRNKWIINS